MRLRYAKTSSFSRIIWLAQFFRLRHKLATSPLAFNALEQNTLFQADAHLTKGNYPLQFWQDNQCFQAQSAVKLNQTISLIPCSGDVPQLRLFKSADYQAQIDMRSGTPTLRISIIQAPEVTPQVMKTCPAWDRKPVEIDVSETFADGEQIRDFYSGQRAQVKHGKVTLMPAK